MAQIFFVRGLASHVEQTAEAIRFFIQIHRMPPEPGGKGGLHPGGAAADDRDFPGGRHGIEIVLAFRARQRVQRTPDTRSARGAGYAAFVAAHASDDVSGLARRNLGGQERIGDKRTAHRHHVRIPAIDDALSRLLVGYAARNDDGHGGLNAVAHGAGKGRVPALLHAGGRGNHEIRLAQPHGNMQSVDAVGYQPLGESDGILQRGAAGKPFNGAHTVSDREIRPHGLADFAADLKGEAHTVFQRTAVSVGAPVGIGGKELADEIAVRPVDFHGVKPGFAGTDGGLAPAFHEAGDFLFAEDRAVVVRGHAGDGGYERHGMARKLGERGAPAVLELDGDARPVPFHAAGQIGEAGQARVVRDAQATGEGVAGGIDGCGLNGDKPGPALGTLFVVAEHTLRDAAVRRGVFRTHGGEDNPVFDQQRVDADWIGATRCVHGTSR